MPIHRRLPIVLGTVLAALVVSAGCVRVPPRDTVSAWTPPPVTAPARATGAAQAILPATPTPAPRVTAPRATATLSPTVRPTATASAVSTAVRTSVPEVIVTPTTDPKLIVVTEDEIAKAIGAGTGAQQGLTVQGLAVDFAEDEMTVGADSLSYSIFQVQNLRVVGKLVAVDGRLQLEVKTITPRSLVTSFIPTAANQALAQYTSPWYVEEVNMREGRLELRVR